LAAISFWIPADTLAGRPVVFVKHWLLAEAYLFDPVYRPVALSALSPVQGYSLVAQLSVFARVCKPVEALADFSFAIHFGFFPQIDRVFAVARILAVMVFSASSYSCSVIITITNGLEIKSGK
jgi:hypothetical protein